MAREKELFLSRWSRRKRSAAPAAEAPKSAVPAAAPGGEAPTLPPLDSLSFDSDFKGFLHPKVDEALRRQALKKLFSSAQFQQPDMMDDFNEDYTLLEALAPGVAQKLAHAKRTLFGDQPEAPASAEAPAESPETQAQSPAPTPADAADAAPPQMAQAEPPQEPGKPDGAAG